MNKTAIHNFAVTARRKLISDIEYRCGLIGITAKNIAEPAIKEKGMESYSVAGGVLNTLYGKDIENRKKIVQLVKQKGFAQFVEEIAYTWFNRIIAIRFMEVNDYLPTKTRVLSSEIAGKAEPDIVTEALQVDLGFTEKQLDYIATCKRDNKADVLYRFLFLRQCNKLGEILPGLFEHMDDYSELLFGLSYIDPNGVLQELLVIPEEDFDVNRGGQVEIIGWLYQYYNEESKDETFALLKRNVKITKERVPSATQLFTPDWIVRYMVENSLGRLWVEGHPNDELRTGWKYYLDEAEQEPNVQKELAEIRSTYAHLKPEDIKFIDPCMGSGHILVYAFDVLMDIYKSVGYTERDAAHIIVEKNLYGLDIDDRAYQLSYFAIMMKARQYDRRFLQWAVENKAQPSLYAIQESNDLNPDYLKLFGDLEPIAKRLVSLFHDAKEFGSILNVDLKATELTALKERIDGILSTTYENIFDNIRQIGLKDLFLPLLKQAIILQQKYDVTVTNPPYMSALGMGARMTQFVKDNYPDSKSDLFAVFIERCGALTKLNGYEAMITQHAWMFLSSFERLRNKLLLQNIVNMAHLGARAFEEIGGEVVQTTTFVLSKCNIANYKANYARLVDYQNQQTKEDAFLLGNNQHKAIKEDFMKIPGSPIAYWVGVKVLRAFSENQAMGTLVPTKKGLDTGENDKFLRYWFEVSFPKVGIGYNNSESFTDEGMKWAPHDKGGSYCRWYGNKEWVINWENNGFDLRHSKANLRSERFYFNNAITWSSLSSGKISFRYSDYGAISNTAGSSLYPSSEQSYYYLGFLNTNVTQYLVDIISPTLNYSAGPVSQIPIVVNKSLQPSITELSKSNIDRAKGWWDAFETSWDFKKHPLI